MRDKDTALQDGTSLVVLVGYLLLVTSAGSCNHSFAWHAEVYERDMEGML